MSTLLLWNLSFSSLCRGRTPNFALRGRTHYQIRNESYWKQSCYNCYKNYHSFTRPFVPSGLNRTLLLKNVFKNGSLEGSWSVAPRRSLRRSVIFRNTIRFGMKKDDAAVVRRASKSEISRLLGLAKNEKWTLTGKQA